MGSDSPDPIRRSKHRRYSSSSDSAEHSKRRKHRHHRHRSHRRHRHDDDVVKHEEGRIEAPGEGREETKASLYVSNPRPESDVEEGEIVEEASGQIMGIDSARVEVGDRASLTLEDNGNDSEDNFVKNGRVEGGENVTNGSGTHNKGVSLQTSSNGDVGLILLKENYSVSKESESPVKSVHERSDNDNYFDSRSRRKLLSSRDKDRYIGTDSLTTRDRYHEEVQSSGRSQSRCQDRERPQSPSISEKCSSMKMTHRKDDPHSKDAMKSCNDSYDERMAVRDWDSGHVYGGGIRDNDRERSSSYNRYGQLDMHQSREPRGSERKRSRESWDEDRFGRDRGSSGNRDKRKDHGRERDKERASSRDSERHSEREKERERERERDKRRDRERARVRYRDREWERTREVEERELERERDWRKERKLEGGWESGRNRSRERESDRDRETGMYRSRDREKKRDGESGMSRSRDRDRERGRDGDRINKNRDYKKVDPLADEQKSKRDEEEQEEYQERVELQLVDQEEDDLERIKEESRRRRQAILEKYKMQHQQQLHKPQLENDDEEHVGRDSQVMAANSVAPETIAVRKEDVDAAAGDPLFIVSKSPPQNGVPASERTPGPGGLGEGTPKSERSADMFCDDIFGNSPAGVRKTGKGDGLAIERGGLHDNWDDAEGYYSFRFGEILDGRYEVTAAHGKGVFSTVVRARDLKAGPGDPEEVAIKIIRNNEHMHKAGKEELVILKKLVGADPEDKRHCVRFLSSFKYRNHLCLVFESLNMNLREVLKKFGRNIGLKLTAVRLYSKQLFIALKHLRNCGVLHCDIKPDNMLVNEAKNVLKLCDFGNAMFAGRNEITPYLVSRFYRAPEIILGLPYDHPLDIWSVGCCIFELYTGKVLFPGATNNDMLRLHMEFKGLFPKKMLRKGSFTEPHFDQDLNFLATEEDPVTKKTMRRLITSIKPKDIGAIVTGSPGEDPKMLANFKDLLEKIFILDPDKRLTVSQALSHAFITGK